MHNDDIDVAQGQCAVRFALWRSMSVRLFLKYKPLAQHTGTTRPGRREALGRAAAAVELAPACELATAFELAPAVAAWRCSAPRPTGSPLAARRTRTRTLPRRAGRWSATWPPSLPPRSEGRCPPRGRREREDLEVRLQQAVRLNR